MHVFQNPYNHFPICSYNPSIIIQRESLNQNRSRRVERRDMPKLRVDELSKTRRDLSTERESSRYREKRTKYKH